MTKVGNSLFVKRSTDEVAALQSLTPDLISAFQLLLASRLLRSRGGGKNIYSDITPLNTATIDNFDSERVKPLLRAAIDNETDGIIGQKVYEAVTESTPSPRAVSSILQTPLVRNTSSFVNSSEYRKHVEIVLREELGPMHVGTPNFFERKFKNVTGLESTAKAVLEMVKEDEPFYSKTTGWI